MILSVPAKVQRHSYLQETARGASFYEISRILGQRMIVDFSFNQLPDWFVLIIICQTDKSEIP